jgi:hypothetical protein
MWPRQRDAPYRPIGADIVKKARPIIVPPQTY